MIEYNNIRYNILDSVNEDGNKLSYAECYSIIDKNKISLNIPSHIPFEGKDIPVEFLSGNFYSSINDSNIEILTVDKYNSRYYCKNNVLFIKPNDIYNLYNNTYILAVIAPCIKTDKLIINIDNLTHIYLETLANLKYIKTVVINTKFDNKKISERGPSIFKYNLIDEYFNFKSLKTLIINNIIYRRDNNNCWRIL